MQITDKHMKQLIKLVNSRFGIVVKENDYKWIKSFIIEYIANHSEICKFEQFISILNNNTDNNLKKSFLNKLTVLKTEFFRNINHFTILKKHLLPLIIKNKEKEENKDKTISIWSSACCTGEEAYSIAMVAKQQFPPEVKNA